MDGVLEIIGDRDAAPTKLVIQDVVKGKGAAAKDGDTLTVRYVGVLYKTGEQFDASWDRPVKNFPFPLGQGQVIPGWDQGLVGKEASAGHQDGADRAG